jgi:hypothetical protein
MKRWMIVVCAALTLAAQAGVSAQGKPDFSGTWNYNQGKSSPGTSGNAPDLPFWSELTVKQSPTELHVASSTVRQVPVTAVYKLDGSTITVPTAGGIKETAAAKLEGANMVITTKRSFASPAGEMVVEFKEVWTLSGNVLTIEKTRTQDGDSVTLKALYDKKS